MAHSIKLGRSMDQGSDNIPQILCEPCYELKDEIKPVAGHSIDCDENLCVDCFNYHLGQKPFRNHKLVDKSAKPKTPSKPYQTKSQNPDEICPLHHGAIIQYFCKPHFQLCCKVCQTIDHKTCDVEEISKMADNILDSQELQALNKKLNTIKKGFEESLRKSGHHELAIQKNFTDAINDMRKLRDEINKLLTETEKLAESVKEEDFKNIETVSSTCNIVIEQINNITSNLDTLNEKKENKRHFISMIRAKSQLQSLEKSLDTLDNDNKVKEYTFKRDEKLHDTLRDLQVFGHLAFTGQVIAPQEYTRVEIIQQQMTKRPVHVKDIDTKSASESHVQMFGLEALLNNQILVTNYTYKKVKQLHSFNGTLISELQLSGKPAGITKVKLDEVAVTVINPNHIQFVNVNQHSLQKGVTIQVNGTCWGIAYNDKDQTFIVTFYNPSKVELINMTGTVLRLFDKDSTGVQLFAYPYHIALSSDMKSMFVSDYSKNV